MDLIAANKALSQSAGHNHNGYDATDSARSILRKIPQRLNLIETRLTHVEMDTAFGKHQAEEITQHIHHVANVTRNRIGTISAIAVALLINFVVGWYHIKEPIPAYEHLLEREKIWATDLGVKIREIMDYDTSRFVEMPLEAGAVMIGMTPQQTQQYIQTVIRTESAGLQRVINKQGYRGLGQFGVSALVSVGLVSKAKFIRAKARGRLRGRDGYIGQNSFLNNPDNWLIDGGSETFLNNRSLQIKAMIDLANLNIRYGYRRGSLHQSDTPQRHAGFAKAAHLVGASKAHRWYKYRIDSQDGNGTKASKYAADGENSIK